MAENRITTETVKVLYKANSADTDAQITSISVKVLRSVSFVAPTQGAVSTTVAM